MAALLTGAGFIWSDREETMAGLMAVLAMLLLYLELCPKCGRLVWREGERHWWSTWIAFPVKSFWIGLECREPVRDTDEIGR